LSTSGGEQVSVPDVTGTTVAEAETALTNAGLELGTVTEKANTDVEAGQIVSQDPEAGESVDEGTRVDVVAAAIPEGVEVPDVTGESVSKARSELRGAGLTSRVNETYHDTVAEGNVIRQSPGAGTRVEEGAEIALTVSLGPKPIENVTVPKVTDMTAAAAQQTIEGAGLTYQTIDYYSATVAAGNVGAQFPAAGESVAPGTRVLLAVSSGPPPGVGVAIPMVVGSTEGDAKDTLEAAGFVVEVFQQASSADEGDVFWQFPEAGSEQPAGATVAIGVSTGS
jgi:serine/threonine-protein kinase